jgi:hypothetical protein
MQTARFGVLAALALGCIAACGSQPMTTTGPAGVGPAMPRAQTGDTIYVVEHYVRAEGRAVFEEFVTQVLWPALRTTATTVPARSRVVQQTRLIRQVSPNDDGSYTYAFLLDPVVPGESYNVLEILRGAYPEAEALEHYSRFTSTWARDFSARPFVQAAAP